ncbi:hypothetical protein [Moorena producens]|uniref:hypothetical protein n=1 Tax=Moorena producens TaxID=1155739 RepID=UPI000AE5F108|nr:hypothetical protein [Moorena producens]
MIQWCVTGRIFLSYRENQGSPVPNAPYATLASCLLPLASCLLPIPCSLFPVP